MGSLHLNDPRLRQRDEVTDCGLERADGQDGELEEEHNHHRGAGLLNDRVDRVSEEPDIVENAEEQRDTEAGVEESGVRGRLLFQDFDSAFAYPTPHFARHQRREHDEEEGAELVAENGHGEACLGDGEPTPLVQLLDFDGSQLAEAETLEAVHERAVDEEDKIDKYLYHGLYPELAWERGTHG